MNLKDVIEYLEMEIQLFKSDLGNKDFGDKAKLLLMHYERLLSMIKLVKSIE